MQSAAEIAQFNRDGFLVIEDVIDPDTVAAVRAEYEALMDRLYDGWAKSGQVPPATPGMRFFDKISAAVKAGIEWYQPLDISLPHSGITGTTPMHIGPAVFDMARHPRIRDIAESLIGPELTSNPIQHVRIKPPQAQVATGETRAHIIQTDWHQDKGVTLAEADDTSMVTIWIAVTVATVENGCLQVKPGLREDMLPHCLLTQPGITDTYLPKDAAIPTPVKAGGAVIFHPLTPHASLPNRSDGYRWSFDLRYSVTGQPTGRDQFPSFIARSRAQPQTELTDWRVWKQMWDDARDALAQTDHIPQHRWPSDGPYCA